MTTFYVRPNSSIRTFKMETAEGDITEIRLDWTAFSDDEGTSVSSAAWSVEYGSASLGSPTTASNVSTILMTTADDSKSKIKVIATTADGQKSTVFIDVRSRGTQVTGDYW